MSVIEIAFTQPLLRDKEVAVVLPVHGDRILMQLRDPLPHIDASGCWGLFGGRLSFGESPKAAMAREIYEEIAYEPEDLKFLFAEKIADLKGIFAYVFSCSLEVPVNKLVLGEGVDLKLVSLSEMLSGQVYSELLQDWFPVVNTYYLQKAFREAFRVSNGK